MDKYTMQFDGYTTEVKSLGIGYMIVANPRAELRVEFVIDKKEVKVTSITRDGTPLFCVWYYVPRKLTQAIIDGMTF